MTREARDITEGNSDSDVGDGEDGLIRRKRRVRETDNVFMYNTLSNNKDRSHNPMEVVYFCQINFALLVDEYIDTMPCSMLCHPLQIISQLPRNLI